MGDLKGVDANLVVVLDAILRERNLTHAGESLGVTQSAISNSLRKLRELLGDDLLVRTGRQFELTPKARELRPLAEAAVAQIDRVMHQLQVFDERRTARKFWIATSDNTMATLTAPLMSVLKEHAPQVSIEFSLLPHMEPGVSPVDLLRYDLVLAGNGLGTPGKHRALYSDEVVCIVSADNHRLQDGALSLADLAALTHVSAPPSPAQGPLDPAGQLREMGIEFASAMSVSNFIAVPMLVSQTQFVGFVPRRLAERLAGRFGLVIAETPLPPSIVVESAYWHPSKTNDPSLQWLLSILLKTAELIEFGGST